VSQSVAIYVNCVLRRARQERKIRIRNIDWLLCGGSTSTMGACLGAPVEPLSRESRSYKFGVIEKKSSKSARAKNGGLQRAAKSSRRVQVDHREAPPKTSRHEMRNAVRKQIKSSRKLKRTRTTPTINVRSSKVRDGASVLADLNLGRIIGKGAHGVVHVAERKSTREMCVVKHIRKSKIVRKHLMDGLIGERNALKCLLGKPFVVQLLDTFQDVAHCNFILEFLQGGDLLHWLNRRTRFSENEVKFYACEIFLGVSTIHAEGFMYRDLKLENCVLDVSGHVKIVDFGFCKMPDSNGRCYSMIGMYS
jgi:serine/threonine protein kinase